MHKGKFENIEHDLVVLQILKLRNISAPKSNEMSKTAPKLMKLQLTDGQNTYSAIEMEPTALSLETRPGTKVIKRSKHIKSPFFFLYILMSLTLNLIKDIFIFVREGLALLMSKTINEVHSHPIIHKFLVLYNRTIYTKEPKICRESKP